MLCKRLILILNIELAPEDVLRVLDPGDPLGGPGELSSNNSAAYFGGSCSELSDSEGNSSVVSTLHLRQRDNLSVFKKEENSVGVTHLNEVLVTREIGSVAELSQRMEQDDNVSISSSYRESDWSESTEDSVNSDSEESEMSVAVDRITRLELLDPHGLCTPGNVIPESVENYEEEKYLRDNFLTDVNGVYVHPLENPQSETITFEGAYYGETLIPLQYSSLLYPIIGPSDMMADNLIHESFLPVHAVDMTSDELDQHLGKVIQMAKRFSPLLFNGLECNVSELEKYQAELVTILLALRKKYKKGADEAIAAAAARRDPSSTWETFDFAKDIGDLRSKCNNSLVDLITLRQQEQRSRRINLEKVKLVMGDYPDFRRAAKVVDKGIHVWTDPKYRKSPYEPFRKQELVLQGVICLNGRQAWAKGQCVIFKEEDLTASQLRHINFNSTFWVRKVGKELGRICLDGSNRTDDRMPVNGGIAKELAIKKTDKVFFKSMPRIVYQYILYKVKMGVPWSEIWLWTEDITDYFPQFKFYPRSALHMGRRVAEGVILIDMFGNMGPTGTPGATQLVGNGLLWKIQQDAKGPVELHVDDFNGCGTKEDSFHDFTLTQSLTREAFNPEAISEKKHQWSQKLVLLGYLVDMLRPGGAGISPKPEAVEKLMDMLINFDPAARHTLHDWQARASMVENYSHVWIGLRTYVQEFHHQVALCTPKARDEQLGYNKKRVKTAKGTASLQFAVEVWRVHLILAWKDPERFSVPLEQYCAFNGLGFLPDKWLGISDACDKRIAVAIWEVNSSVPVTSTDHLTLIAWMSVPLHYKWKKKTKTSKFQNYLEYIGTVLQFILANIICPLSERPDDNPLVIKVLQDNKTALSWQQKNKCCSQHSQLACWGLTYMKIHSRIEVINFEHIPAVDPFMFDIDRESRRDDPSKGLGPGIYCDSLPKGKELQVSDYPIVSQFIELVDPMTDIFAKGGYHDNYVKVAEMFGPFVNR